VSTADAVLFMLSTSLSRDLFQAVLRPRATDAELLRVGRLASVAGGALGTLFALVLPSVMSALTLFYGVMTAALLVPLVGGLLLRRPRAVHARLAILLSVGVTGALRLTLGGTGLGAWLPTVAGVAVSSVVFAVAVLSGDDERPGGVHSDGPGGTS
jgi:SSS family solute:Na+ symporter